MDQKLKRIQLKSIRKCVGIYLSLSQRVWNHLPRPLTLSLPGRAYGRHLHALVSLYADLYAERKQYHSTWFLRNRSELELMCRLVGEIAFGSNLDICVLACSKGAEVYSFLWAIRTSRPDLRVKTFAVDVSQEIIDFAKEGVYSRKSPSPQTVGDPRSLAGAQRLAWNTFRDQGLRHDLSIFSRMTEKEMERMFEMTSDQIRVRSWLKEGIIWFQGDAGDPDLVGVIDPQDIVVANRFLCHMAPAAAEKCLRNIARLVKPGGHLFVSGIDLDVRTKVAREMGWKPVTDLIKEIHEGDPSLRQGWPLEYWGLEPFCDDLPDWRLRYASVFRIGEALLEPAAPFGVQSEHDKEINLAPFC